MSSAVKINDISYIEFKGEIILCEVIGLFPKTIRVKPVNDSSPYTVIDMCRTSWKANKALNKKMLSDNKNRE